MASALSGERFLVRADLSPVLNYRYFRTILRQHKLLLFHSLLDMVLEFEFESFTLMD